MNIYTVNFFAICPNNGIRISYTLKIKTSLLIEVEEIIKETNKIVDGFHEELADNFFERFGGEQIMTAEHHGVHIETVRIKI